MGSQTAVDYPVSPKFMLIAIALVFKFWRPVVLEGGGGGGGRSHLISK